MITVEPNNPVLEVAAQLADVTPATGGRPATTRRRKQMVKALREGTSEAIDRGWLLEQLLSVYQAGECKPQDRLRALELMAKVSGYGNRTEEPEDERKAIADLMADMAGSK
jgi:hypothetical protein